MKHVLLLVILLFALFLRSFDLTNLPNGLHWDEQDTGYQAFSLLKTGKDYFGNPIPLFLHSFADYRTPVFIYSAVPFIKLFGLTAAAVRLPSVTWGLLAILLMYVVGSLMFKNSKIGLLASLSLAVSPWHVLYGRQSVECNAMLTCILMGLAAFYQGLKKPAWFILSAIGFGLAIASYSPAKFFVPLLGILLGVLYFKKIFVYKKLAILAIVTVVAMSGPIIYDGIFGVSGSRFHDVSITTDPTVATEVNYQREHHAVSGGAIRAVGLAPTFMDKALINKPVLIISKFISNYIATFSTEYLFLKGDQNLRHSPSLNSIGQLHLIEIVPFVLGLIVMGSGLKSNSSRLLAFWLLAGPISSSLTRDGGPHAARTFLMLPAFVLTVALGISQLVSRSKFRLFAYLALLSISCIFVFDYFFSFYRYESAKPFHWGFDQVVKLAVANSPKYEHVVIDLHTDSALMAYLFTTQLDPAKFQSMHPIPQVTFAKHFKTAAFGNILLMDIGSRAWPDIFGSPDYTGHNLIISAADQPQVGNRIAHLQEIDYPDSTPAFYLFTK